MCWRKLRSPKKNPKKYTSKCSLLYVKRIHKNYAPVFNEFTSISVGLYESEVMNYCNLDEIELGPSCIWILQRLKVYHYKMHMRSSIMMEFELNNPYIPIEQEIIGMLDERDDAANNLIEEVDNERIGDVVVDRVGFKDVESAHPW